MKRPIPPRLSWSARVVAAKRKFWSSLSLSVVICSAIALLENAGFGPLIFLSEVDENIYALFHTPSVGTDLRPVIFVDINDVSLKDMGIPLNTRTPRGLLADIVRKAKSNSASVIFLDIDLRDPTNNEQDRKLEDALQLRGTPVLLPQVFSSTPDCLTESITTEGREPDLVPLAVRWNYPSVIAVHGLLEPGASGLIRRVCSSYRFGNYSRAEWSTIPAAMLKAVEVADRSCGAENRPRPMSLAAQELSTHGAATDLPLSWRLTNQTRVFPLPPRRWAFRRISANWLLKTGDTSALNCAIVIVGATHQAAFDTVSTPIGRMPGALAQANAALTFQDAGTTSWTRDDGLNLLFLFAVPVITAFLALRLGMMKEPSLSRALVDILIELATSLSLWFFFSAIMIGVVGQPWRFGVLSQLSTTLIAFVGQFSQFLDVAFMRLWPDMSEEKDDGATWKDRSKVRNSD
jgi:CHASE2 domain-containing sensor protein